MKNEYLVNKFPYSSEESYVVFDYCQRSLLQLSSGDVIPQFPAKDINHTGKYIMFMSLLENHAGKPVDLVKFLYLFNVALFY